LRAAAAGLQEMQNAGEEFTIETVIIFFKPARGGLRSVVKDA
jgi:hypothetical protein